MSKSQSGTGRALFYFFVGTLNMFMMLGPRHTGYGFAASPRYSHRKIYCCNSFRPHDWLWTLQEPQRDSDRNVLSLRLRLNGQITTFSTDGTLGPWPCAIGCNM